MSALKSLARKTFVLVFALSFVVMLAVAIAVTAASFTSCEREAERYLLSQACALADAVEECSDAESMCQALEDYPLIDTRCTLVAPDGSVLYDSQVPVDELGNHADRREIIAALQSGQAVSLRQSKTLGADTLYAAVVVDDGFVLRLAETRTSLAAFLGDMSFPLIMALIAIFVASIVASRLITQMVVKPLLEIDLSEPLENDAYEEIQPLLFRVDAQRRELESQNEELERAASLRRDFTGNVSHELKSPLQVIGGYAELMENGIVPQEDVPRFAGLIRRESDTMQNLVEDILVLSRLDEGGSSELELVDVAQSCSHATARLAPKIESHDILVDLRLGDNCFVKANDQLIEQMVYNLLDNAIAFSPEGCSVLVDVSRAAGNVVLRVSDSGPGIPDGYKSRVFERFFRVDTSRGRETGGTGLGLAIVKHVVETCGGQVHVEDVVPHGASFVVLLPACESVQY